jgi:hypothetical protein
VLSLLYVFHKVRESHHNTLLSLTTSDYYLLILFTIVDTVDNAPTSELEPEDKPQEVESKPSEILDSSGRPLFGGLRALKATTTISRSSSSPQDRNKIPTTEDNMPEQPVSSHLRELVSKHEQNSR